MHQPYNYATIEHTAKLTTTSPERWFLVYQIAAGTNWISPLRLNLLVGLTRTSTASSIRLVTMPANPPDNDLCQALLDFVADGRFPETDSIVSAEFPAATVSKGLDVISTARAEVEVRSYGLPDVRAVLTGLYYSE